MRENDNHDGQDGLWVVEFEVEDGGDCLCAMRTGGARGRRGQCDGGRWAGHEACEARWALGGVRVPWQRMRPRGRRPRPLDESCLSRRHTHRGFVRPNTPERQEGRLRVRCSGPTSRGVTSFVRPQRVSAAHLCSSGSTQGVYMCGGVGRASSERGQRVRGRGR